MASIGNHRTTTLTLRSVSAQCCRNHVDWRKEPIEPLFMERLFMTQWTIPSVGDRQLHLSQESPTTSTPWLATLGKNTFCWLILIAPYESVVETVACAPAEYRCSFPWHRTWLVPCATEPRRADRESSGLVHHNGLPEQSHSLAKPCPPSFHMFPPKISKKKDFPPLLTSGLLSSKPFQAYDWVERDIPNRSTQCTGKHQRSSLPDHVDSFQASWKISHKHH